MVASAGSCFTDRSYCAASPQASHRALPGPRSMFQNAEKFMKELQEEQAIYPRPETPRLYGLNCMVRPEDLKASAFGSSCQHFPAGTTAFPPALLQGFRFPS